MNQQPEIGCARTSITSIKEFQEFGNYQEPIICNMWRGYTEINLSEDIQPILKVFVIVSSLERSEKFIILKKKNPTDFINKRLAFIICGTKCLCFSLSMLTLDIVNHWLVLSIRNATVAEVLWYVSRWATVAEISMVKVSIALLLCYRCRDFYGKRLCCTAFVLQLKRFYGKSFRCTAFVHGLFDGVKDTNSTSSPPGQSFSSLKQFIGTGHYIL